MEHLGAWRCVFSLSSGLFGLLRQLAKEFELFWDQNRVKNGPKRHFPHCAPTLSGVLKHMLFDPVLRMIWQKDLEVTGNGTGTRIGSQVARKGTKLCQKAKQRAGPARS